MKPEQSKIAKAPPGFIVGPVAPTDDWPPRLDFADKFPAAAASRRANAAKAREMKQRKQAIREMVGELL